MFKIEAIHRLLDSSNRDDVFLGLVMAWSTSNKNMQKFSEIIGNRTDYKGSWDIYIGREVNIRIHDRIPTSIYGGTIMASVPEDEVIHL